MEFNSTIYPLVNPAGPYVWIEHAIPWWRFKLSWKWYDRRNVCKTHYISLLHLSGTEDMTIVWMDTVYLERTFAKTLEESVILIILNQFVTYMEITPDGSVLLNLATWKQIK